MDDRTKAELLKRVSIFADLSDSEIETLARLEAVREFPKDTPIIHRMDPGDSMFIIASGKVKVSLYGEDGREIILSTLGPGDFFGEMSLLDQEPRSADVTTKEDAVLLQLKRDDFVSHVQKFPSVALNILAEMSRRLRRADEKIGNLVLLDVYGRVARVLLEISQNEGVVTDEGIVIENRPTHQEIASMIGTSRETVSRVLSDLSKDGYIRVHGKKIVLKG
ncbi:MAG: Crp/Fnr family transcriptional regulator [Deltaproteobacteria bacterium]|nr:Crp/Fnr family transcriptional regulator [Deltaproteobacteria bacterium]